MLETITKLKAPQKRTSSASKWPAPYAIMSHLWILYYLAKGVVVRLDDGGRIVGHPSRCWCWHWRRRTCWVKSDRQGDGASSMDGGNMYVDEELWWWWLWGGGVGFGREECLGPNEGIELLGETAGKRLVAAAASFEVVWRRYIDNEVQQIRIRILPHSHCKSQ